MAFQEKCGGNMNEGLLFPEVSYLQPLQELGPMYSSFLPGSHQV
ncbi:hypothetical protein AC88_4172 [Escherichia coli 3-267-03_S4_C1]|nr:hypothetical protein AC88_4172 [Escherichia coli 3-267-03_S4_C1]